MNWSDLLMGRGALNKAAATGDPSQPAPQDPNAQPVPNYVQGEVARQQGMSAPQGVQGAVSPQPVDGPPAGGAPPPPPQQPNPQAQMQAQMRARAAQQQGAPPAGGMLQPQMLQAKRPMRQPVIGMNPMRKRVAGPQVGGY